MSISISEDVEELIVEYKKHEHEFDIFRNTVVQRIEKSPELSFNGRHIVHSIKSRLKQDSSLRDKIIRKKSAGKQISADNLFSKITDFAGVRVILLRQTDVKLIHDFIRGQQDSGNWIVAEEPIAYTWDPETSEFLRSLGVNCLTKESYYTSVHYLVKPHEGSKICCEIQVRTLFEEIWGEVDHFMNYPYPVDSEICRIQIKVLAKLIATGSRLVDTIFYSLNGRNS